ncbi:MAG: mannose-1-phosphate guanylyltransferase [Flavobacterium sp.]
MTSNKFAVLMAGGVGSRFWPVSTPDFPKQFHDMLGTGETLLQRTFRRLEKLLPAEHILILTNERYSALVQEQLPEVPKHNILLEPAMRNTAPCILYAALKIQKRNPDALMIVAPSDHWIENEEAFVENVNICFEFAAQHQALLTLGIQPTFPNTGYGYIEFDQEDSNALKKVKQFREKPNYETAQQFLKSGNFLWNGGIFMWSVSTILNAFQTFQHEMTVLFNQGANFWDTDREQAFINEHYAQAENISIDYAILEKSSSVYVLPATFDWNDLGTWGSLYDKLEKDESNNAIVNAKVYAEESSGNIIRTENGKTVVIKGLNDYIVVDKQDTLLIFPKKEEQNIKQIANNL